MSQTFSAYRFGGEGLRLTDRCWLHTRITLINIYVREALPHGVQEERAGSGAILCTGYGTFSRSVPVDTANLFGENWGRLSIPERIRIKRRKARADAGARRSTRQEYLDRAQDEPACQEDSPERPDDRMEEEVGDLCFVEVRPYGRRKRCRHQRRDRRR